MPTPKVKIKVLKEREYEEIEVEVVQHALVPDWVFKGVKCDKCHHEIKAGYALAVETKYNGVRILHTSCYDRIITY